MAILTDEEASILRLILFKRGLRPGAPLSELEKISGEGLDEVISSLDQKLGEIGLEVVTVEESDDLLGEGRRRVMVRSREPLHSKEVKLCGWDRRFLAALAVACAYLVSRGGRAREEEVVSLLKSKGISARKVERMVEAGYLTRGREGVLGLGWRALAEIDQDELRRLLMERRKTG